jgi:hypothetical protein
LYGGGLEASTGGRSSVQAEHPHISIWTNRDDPYRRGEPARVYFKVDDDAYITVLRVDTDGRVRILFPAEPWEDNFARGGRTFEVTGTRDHAFDVDDYPGIGYVFGIVASEPFDYDPIVRGDHWDYRIVPEGRIRGDPYVAISDLAERITGGGTYDYDLAEYSVERHYDYPRFLCYDCHTYASYTFWDPYSAQCSRFRIVVYDEPAYYPYRTYGGRNVVIARPLHPAPRFVFKEHDAANPYVTRVRERPRDPRNPRDGARRESPREPVPAPIAPRIRRETPPDRPLPPDTARHQGRVAAPTTAPPGREVPAPASRPVEPPEGESPQPRRPPEAATARPPAEKENQGRPRVEPKGKRPAPKPKSTGEPTLRRRKPH